MIKPSTGGAKPGQRPRLAGQRRQSARVQPPKILKTRGFSGLRGNTLFPRKAWWWKVVICETGLRSRTWRNREKTGNFARLRASERQATTAKTKFYQRLTSKFPASRNREFSVGDQGF